MKKRSSNTELWIGANWLARQCKINDKNVRYWSIKLRLRYFKFSGVRYLEKSDAECLVEVLAKRFGNIDKSFVLNQINQYHY